jgi:hypothetical protein
MRRRGAATRSRWCAEPPDWRRGMRGLCYLNRPMGSPFQVSLLPSMSNQWTSRPSLLESLTRPFSIRQLARASPLINNLPAGPNSSLNWSLPHSVPTSVFSLITASSAGVSTDGRGAEVSAAAGKSGLPRRGLGRVDRVSRGPADGGCNADPAGPACAAFCGVATGDGDFFILRPMINPPRQTINPAIKTRDLLFISAVFILQSGKAIRRQSTCVLRKKP